MMASQNMEIAMKQHAEHDARNGKTERFDYDSAPAADPFTPFAPKRATRNGAKLFGAALFILTFALIVCAGYLTFGSIEFWSLVVGVIAGFLVLSWIHIVMEWERVVVFRLGAFRKVASPGMLFTIPLVDQCVLHVDMRTIATPFGAERTLTSDLVPVNIDAVLFWMVWDAKKACLEVEDYYASVSYIAQTAMRDAIGRSSIAEVALRRDQLDKELKEVIEKETAPWGIAVLSVKVRDIVVPEELQEAMSLEAIAEREKNARMVLAGAEEDISELLSSASRTYDESETGLQLRTLHLLYETVRNSNGTVITVPSSLSDGVSSSLSDAVSNLLDKK